MPIAGLATEGNLQRFGTKPHFSGGFKTVTLIGGRLLHNFYKQSFKYGIPIPKTIL